MTVKYKVISKKNPRDIEAAPKFYVTSVVAEKIDLDSLAKSVARSSTVARADIYATLIALIEEISDNLSKGNMVYLGKLGSLAVSLKS